MEMKRYLLLLLMLITFAYLGYSQKLQVESFKLEENDLSAQIQPRKDLNDKNCALVKVQFVGTISKAEGNVVMPLVKRGNETWVYMPQGSRQLKLLTESYLPVAITFSDYGIEKLDSNRTYVLVLSKPLSSIEQQKQSLTIKYSPSSATVLVDNKMVRGNNGIAKAMLPIGQHSFVVFCDGYESEEGTVKLKTSAPSNLQIVLSKEMALNSNSIGITRSESSQPSDMSSHSIPSSYSSESMISIPIKDGVSLDMVKVEAGSFMMGATSDIKDAFKEEKPAHKVTLTHDYYMGLKFPTP